ncbi:methyl-accepting chemotaxis protein [Geomonas paludis]|uniref:Methyl-accepting chemotaxis protein n=1 Tax=Geomonas paludis TaxID=2740185 RepID=A0A6V8MZ17_9BACT|nr:methyl-accepting chemotaxis protein [Geomonas paludis]UPU36829.1 methyl-accepting chemotaxis protein [Geomonas paludis]GFO65495.1 methyl-accepting chemotaxis protein [Geomonas paludis]
MNISKKIFIANVAIVLIATITTSAVTLYVIKKEITRQVTVGLTARSKAFRELVAPNGSGFAMVDGKLQANGTVLDGRNDLTDKMKEIFGGEATIFRGDVRVATTIKKDDGSRAVGTSLQGAAREAVMDRAATYVGEAKILGTPHFASYLPLLDNQGKVIGALFVGEKKSQFLAVFDDLKYLSLGISVLLAGLLALVAFLVMHRALEPMRALIATLKHVAEGDGDLTRRLAESDDEIGTASRYFNLFIERVHAIVQTVADNANSVTEASSELHKSTEQLARTTEEVAGQTETVSTAGEEMAATSADISRNCLQAVESAQRACDMATIGSADVERSIRGMQLINEKVRLTSESVSSLGAMSQQIGEIINTIQDIADQTNLLALNAAIEAARAGEQGRGFAVVADEVRSLAERTTHATKEIESNIRSIQDETTRAVQVMQESAREAAKGAEDSVKSGQSLEGILKQINEVTLQIGQIATAAEEQSATSREISNNVHQITGIIQGTARANRESMATADKLNSLSANLKGQISRFSY